MTPNRSDHPSPRSAHPVAGPLSRRTVIVATGIGLTGVLRAEDVSPSSLLGAAADRDALEPLIAVERLQTALYRAALARFDAAVFGATGWPDGLHADLGTIADQEEDHLAALNDALRGGEPAPEPAVDAMDPGALLETAAEVENLAVAAYAGAAATVANRRLRRTLLGIHSVEARHAAYLAAVLGRPAFPDPIDAPLGRDAVLAAVASFESLAGPDATPAAASPSAGDAGADDPRFRELLEDAAARLAVAREDLTVTRIEARAWPDAALGCPEPGTFYAQVVTPGFLVVVTTGGQELQYHTDDRGTFVSC